MTLQVNLNGVAITPGSDVLLKLIPSIYTYTESARVRLFLFLFYSDFAVAKLIIALFTLVLRVVHHKFINKHKSNRKGIKEMCLSSEFPSVFAFNFFPPFEIITGM